MPQIICITKDGSLNIHFAGEVQKWPDEVEVEVVVFWLQLAPLSGTLQFASTQPTQQQAT